MRKNPRAHTPAPQDDYHHGRQAMPVATIDPVSENQPHQGVKMSGVSRVKSYRIGVVFAPAGGGKATLASRLQGRFEDMIHLEMSQHVRRQPDGSNTPDEDVIPVFEEVFDNCNALGWPILIDGFPRSMTQAIAFCNNAHELGLIEDIIMLDYQVARGVSIDRQVARGIELRGTGRRSDIPDSDDELRALCARRYDRHQAIRPQIIAHFKDTGIRVVTINGNASPEEIEQAVYGELNWEHLPSQGDLPNLREAALMEGAGVFIGRDRLPHFMSTADA